MDIETPTLTVEDLYQIIGRLEVENHQLKLTIGKLAAGHPQPAAPAATPEPAPTTDEPAS